MTTSQMKKTKKSAIPVDHRMSPYRFCWTPSHYDLTATMESGQAFQWKWKDGSWWGDIDGIPCQIRQTSDGIFYEGADFRKNVIEDYLQIHWPWKKATLTYPQDEWMKMAMQYCGGIRILRQDPWETLASFICSAMKRVTQIQEIHHLLRIKFGSQRFSGWKSFPSPAVLYRVGEQGLRSCKLGFRAKGLWGTARKIVEEKVDLKSLEGLPTALLRAMPLSNSGAIDP